MVERLSAAMHFARTDVFWDLGLFMGQSFAYFQPLDTTGVPTTPLLPFAAPSGTTAFRKANRQCDGRNVWLGNDDDSATTLSGAKAPLDAWYDFMTGAHRLRFD